MIISILLQAAAGAAGAAGALGAASPWIAAGGAALQLGIGISQLMKARKLRDTKRPTMTTPEELSDLYRRRKFAAGVYGLPGQGQIEAKMARQQAGSLRAIQQSGQSAASQIAGIAAIDQASKEATERLGVQAAQYKSQQEQLYDQAQREMAGQKMREWQYNVADPFQEKKLAYASLYQSGITSLSQFASNTAKLFSSAGAGTTA